MLFWAKATVVGVWNTWGGYVECRTSIIAGLTTEDIKPAKEFNDLPVFMVTRGLSQGTEFQNVQFLVNNKKFQLSDQNTVIYSSKVGCPLCVIAEGMLRETIAKYPKIRWLIVEANKSNELYTKALQDSMPNQVQIIKQKDSKEILKALNTTSKPIIALVSKELKLHAMWRGFDPARGEAIRESIEKFAQGQKLPTSGDGAGQRLLEIGKAAPNLSLNNWTPLSNKNATVVYVTDAGRPACQDLHPVIIDFFGKLKSKGIDVRIIDITGNQNILAQRLQFIKKYAIQQVSDFSVKEAAKISQFNYPLPLSVFNDPRNSVGLMWGNDLTPKLWLFDSTGKLRQEIPYRKSFSSVLYQVEMATKTSR